VHHETTSGLLNPLGQIAVLAKRYRCLFIVDAISSVAGEEIRLRQWGIDALIGSANKCIRGVSGLSFAVLSRRFIRCLSDRQKAPFYLNLYEHLVMERTGQTPFTPAVHCFYALREALRELKQQGLRRRISRYKEIASLLRGGLRRMGLKVYLPDRLSANTMTTVILPKAISYGWLHRQCKRRGYCIYSAVGRLKGRAFRLGTVGCISKSDIRGFLKALARIVNQRGRQT
jgi:aspartate aminotransferase-like enzyme